LPKTKAETKDAIIYLRLTSKIRNQIEYQAAQEGVTTSEWLRKLVIKELRERNALPTTFRMPNLIEPNTEHKQQK
jgi:antitoxin component of RelBE/YafQ-DinJ toxin-antitoxin module